MKRVLLINSNFPERKIVRELKKYRILEWVGLTSDFMKLRALEAKLKSLKFIRVETAAALQQSAGSLRRPFLELIGRMAKLNASFEWWANGISEKNTMINKLFLHSCYVALADNLLKSKRDFCIICDDNAVIRSIFLRAKNYRYSTKIITVYNFNDSQAFIFAKGAKILLYSLYNWILARINKFFYGRPAGRSVNPDIIIHTWVDEKCFGKDGRFKDRYFTVLPEFYRRKGFKVSTFITLYDLKRHYWDAITFFRNSADLFIIPEDYYRIYDYIFPFYIWFKRLRFCFSSVMLDNIDLSLLFRRSNLRDGINFTTMYYILFMRLSKKGVAPKVILDGFENMVSDKVIQLGVRKFMPRALFYGYYHVLPSPNILCFFTDRNELDFTPLPDRIICNGQRIKNILIQEQFPEERIKLGCALRHFYLYNLDKKCIKSAINSLRILLLFSIEKDLSLELFYKLKSALDNFSGYSLYIKPHPMDAAISDIICRDLPDNSQILNCGMAEAFAKCDVVVSAATNAVVDCIMADKKVIRVGSDIALDFDPLAWFNEFGRIIYSTNELRDNLDDFKNKLLSGGESGSSFSHMLPEFFLDATEDNMQAFIPASKD